MMKSKVRNILIALLAFTLFACVPVRMATQTVSVPPGMSNSDVIEAAIEVAREMKLPAATKIDKVNGVVDFGGFGMPQLGKTAQVRIKSDKEIEVSIQRQSMYVPLSADDSAASFKSKLAERLRTAAEKQ